MKIVNGNEREEKQMTLSELKIGDHFRFVDYPGHGLCRVVNYGRGGQHGVNVGLWLEESADAVWERMKSELDSPVIVVKDVRLVVPE